MQYKNLTDLDLYNTFVRIETDGRAASMYDGNKLLWEVVTGVKELTKWHMYAQVGYAMLAASYSVDDLVHLNIQQVQIEVQKDGSSKKHLIDAVHSDTEHAITDKLYKDFERVTSYASKNNNG